MYVESVLWIQADAIIALLRCCLISDGPMLQSYYYCFLYCLSNKTWIVKVVSSCVSSGRDRESLVSEKKCSVRNKLKQSIIISERAMLTIPSDAGRLWSIK